VRGRSPAVTLGLMGGFSKRCKQAELSWISEFAQARRQTHGSLIETLTCDAGPPNCSRGSMRDLITGAVMRQWNHSASAPQCALSPGIFAGEWRVPRPICLTPWAERSAGRPVSPIGPDRQRVALCVQPSFR